MDSYDTAVSNGTCYWKAGVQAGRHFIPCGNAYAPDVNFQCCSRGDICFDNGACYNDGYSATYFAACTDSNYEAPECPNKGNYSDQRWTGLVTCHTSSGEFDKDETWAGCPEPDLDHLTSFTKGCECNRTNPALFTDYADLVKTAQLPYSSGGSIRFINGHEASTIFVTVTPTSLSSSATAGGPTSFRTSQTSTTAAEPTSLPADEAPGSTTRTKAGIGAGVAGAALLLGLVAILAWLLRRRNKKKEQELVLELELSPQPASASSTEPQSASVLDPQTNTPKPTGNEAELPGDCPPSAGSIVSPMSPAIPQSPMQQRQYEAYNPERHGNYSQYPIRPDTLSPQRDAMRDSAFSVSPQHTGSSQDRRSGGNEWSGQQSMAPIAELES